MGAEEKQFRMRRVGLRVFQSLSFNSTIAPRYNQFVVRSTDRDFHSSRFVFDETNTTEKPTEDDTTTDNQPDDTEGKSREQLRAERKAKKKEKKKKQKQTDANLIEEDDVEKKKRLRKERKAQVYTGNGSEVDPNSDDLNEEIITKRIMELENEITDWDVQVQMKQLKREKRPIYDMYDEIRGFRSSRTLKQEIYG